MAGKSKPEAEVEAPPRHPDIVSAAERFGWSDEQLAHAIAEREQTAQQRLTAATA